MDALSAVRARLAPVKDALSAVPGLPDMFERCFLNTLETTVQTLRPGDTFIITGDIEAMWLRDSTAQVLHYLRFADDEGVAKLIEGLIARVPVFHLRCTISENAVRCLEQALSGN